MKAIGRVDYSIEMFVSRSHFSRFLPILFLRYAFFKYFFVGYGNFSPKTDGGKIFCIIYGLVGIPICGIFLATTTDYFSNKCLRLFERQKKRKHDKWHSILIAAFFFLLPGLAVFLFVPAAIFTVLEVLQWLCFKMS